MHFSELSSLAISFVEKEANFWNIEVEEFRTVFPLYNEQIVKDSLLLFALSEDG